MWKKLKNQILYYGWGIRKLNINDKDVQILHRFNINVLQNHMEIFVDIDNTILKVTGHTTLTTLQKPLPMKQTN